MSELVTPISKVRDKGSIRLTFGVVAPQKQQAFNSMGTLACFIFSSKEMKTYEHS